DKFVALIESERLRPARVIAVIDLSRQRWRQRERQRQAEQANKRLPVATRAGEETGKRSSHDHLEMHNHVFSPLDTARVGRVAGTIGHAELEKQEGRSRGGAPVEFAP